MSETKEGSPAAPVTGFLRYGADLEVLVVTKGHPFERDAFFSVFESWRDIACTAVEQPAAQAFFTPEAARPYDAIVLYDMPGIEFARAVRVFHDPPKAYRRGVPRACWTPVTASCSCTTPSPAGRPGTSTRRSSAGASCTFPARSAAGRCRIPATGTTCRIVVRPVADHPVLEGLGRRLRDRGRALPVRGLRGRHRAAPAQRLRVRR